MTDTFTPPVAPSTDLTAQTTARVNEAGFGDGYVQRTPDGLNSLDQTVSLQWADTLTKAQVTEIRQFFEAKLGATPFFYQLPDEDAPRKWVCKTWSRAYQRHPLGLYTLRAEFTEDFSP